jgi:hypothetical protein
MCASGFEPASGGCEPILPNAACAAGTMAVPGDAACRPIAPCGTGTWGDIPVDETTQYVDQAYDGADSDGSAARPWTTIAQGIAAVEEGGLVAIAAGSYVEDVMIPTGKPLRLWGVCPSEVEIVGTGVEMSTVYVRQLGHGTELRSLAITGPGAGVVMTRSLDVLFEHLWIHDTGIDGIHVRDTLGPASIVVRGSLVERAGEQGMFFAGVEATVEGTVIRASQPRSDDQTLGRGLVAQYNPETDSPCALSVLGSVLEANHELGMFAACPSVTVEGSVVRGTQPRSSDDLRGRGISTSSSPVEGSPSALTIRSSVIEDNHDVGLFITGADVVAESTVVRRTSTLEDGASGRGVSVQVEQETFEPASLELRSSLIEDNSEIGLYVSGCVATAESLLVRRTDPTVGSILAGMGVYVRTSPRDGTRGQLEIVGSVIEDRATAGLYLSGSAVRLQGSVVRRTTPGTADQVYGRGVVAQICPDTAQGSNLTMRASAVEDSREVGVFVYDADATLEGCRIAGTTPNEAGYFGDGVLVGWQQIPSTAAITGTSVENSSRAALASFGADVAVASSTLQCQSFDLNGERWQDTDHHFDDQGGNLCGCPEPGVQCVAISAGLSPPAPAPAIE